MDTYEFHVYDNAEGPRDLWGSVRVQAKGARVAEVACRAWLDKEVEPNGSLCADYWLELVTPTKGGA